MPEPISELPNKVTNFEGLAKQYGIHQGAEISIKKVGVDDPRKSGVKVGSILSGIIGEEIGLGKPFILYNEGQFNGRTTPIIDIKETEDGQLRFLTASKSIYELVPKKDENKKLEEIKKNINKQPDTTRDIVSNHQDLFVLSKEIDGKKWFFTANSGGMVIALVNDDKTPDIFHPRFFRISGSDHQFKACPGYRSNMAILKGNERDKNHHYVQSAKLDSRIIEILQTLPTATDNKKKVSISDYIPIMSDPDNGKLGKNLEDFNFSEEQVVFKNKDWQKTQDNLRYFLKIYTYLNHFTGMRKVGDFCDVLESVGKNLNVGLGKISQIKDNLPQEVSKNWTMDDVLSDDYPSVRNLGDEISRVGQNITESIFTHEKFYQHMEQIGFIPDFNQEPVKRYVKTDGVGNRIKIEVFKNSSPEGDILCWEMATDDKGRVYIDNIYDPTVGIDSYGTPKKKANMGILVYKPEDYDSQITFVPKKYTKNLGDYIDISRLIELSRPVVNYKTRRRY